MRTSSRRTAGFVAVLGIVGASLAYAAMTDGGDATPTSDRGDAKPTSTVTIESSYIFDVADKRLLIGYADNVFTGRVVEELGVSEDSSHTLYRVDVLQTVKGGLEGQVVVSQLGYANDNEVHETDDQPLLEVGKSYLLVTTNDVADSRRQTLVAGPAATVKLDTAAAVNSTMTEYTRAFREQRYPPGVPPRG